MGSAVRPARLASARRQRLLARVRPRLLLRAGPSAPLPGSVRPPTDLRARRASPAGRADLRPERDRPRRLTASSTASDWPRSSSAFPSSACALPCSSSPDPWPLPAPPRRFCCPTAAHLWSSRAMEFVDSCLTLTLPARDRNPTLPTTPVGTAESVGFGRASALGHEG